MTTHSGPDAHALNDVTNQRLSVCQRTSNTPHDGRCDEDYEVSDTDSPNTGELLQDNTHLFQQRRIQTRITQNQRDAAEEFFITALVQKTRQKS